MQDSEEPRLTELSPLLPASSDAGPRESRRRSFQYQVQSRVTISSLLVFSAFCFSVINSFCSSPIDTLLEDALCSRYYLGKDEPKGDCQLEEIRLNLAWYVRMLTLVRTVTAMAVVVPYGMLSDRTGRRYIFVLSTLGITVALLWMIIMLQLYDVIPFHFVFLVPVLQVIGGGMPTLMAIIYSIAADSVKSEHRAKVLLRIAAFSYIGKLLGTNLSARMVKWGSPSLPIMLAFMLVPVGAAVITFIPETLEKQEGSSSSLDMEHADLTRPRNAYFSVGVLFLCCALQKPIIAGGGLLLSQYMEGRLDWSEAEVSWVQNIRTVSELFVYLFMLPVLSFILRSGLAALQLSSSKVDLRLAQVSGFFLATGSYLMMAPSSTLFLPGIGLYTMAIGFVRLCSSILLSHISRHATTFAMIYVVQAAAGLATTDAIQSLFDIAKQNAGILSGLPYIVLGSVFSLVLGLLLFVQPGSLGHDTEERIVVPPQTQFNIRARMSRAVSIIAHSQ